MDAIVCVPPLLLQAIFADLTQLARQTHFVQRLRALKPDAFAHTLCLYLIRYPHATLEQLADQLHITASALAQRFTDNAAKFLRILLQRTLDTLATAIPTRCVIPLLRRFNGVYLVDGTITALPATLAQRFPGYGGGAGTDDPTTAAAVKILLRLRIDTTQATELLLAAATTPDIHLLQQLPELPEGALHIGDLGFFDCDYFAALTRKGIYWLTRLPARIKVREELGDWQELADWLQELARLGLSQWEGTQEVGKTTPVVARVMVLRCPPEESARRRQKLHDRLRRKGQTAGQRQLTLCDWWVLATNVAEPKLPAKAAWELYRLRWQIELVFKRWKSLGGLSINGEHDPIRAECELYGKLVGVLLIDWLALQRGGALSGVSLWRGWQIVEELLPEILRALSGRRDWGEVLSELDCRLTRRPKLAKRKRRPSTRQRLFRVTLTN
jgi:DDE family transposase